MKKQGNGTMTQSEESIMLMTALQPFHHCPRPFRINNDIRG